jgi:hypothetical protein
MEVSKVARTMTAGYNTQGTSSKLKMRKPNTLSNRDIDRLHKAMDRAIADNDYEAQRRINRELLEADE